MKFPAMQKVNEELPGFIKLDCMKQTFFNHYDGH